MDRKAQMSVGLLILIFLGAIVSLVLLQATFGDIGKVTNTMSLVNYSITIPASGGRIDLVGQELLSTPYVQWNDTISNVTTTIGSANYTIAETISATDGLKRISYNTTADGAGASGETAYVSYSYGAEGYADSSGARAITSLIVIMAAIAIMVYVLLPTIREKFGW